MNTNEIASIAFILFLLLSLLFLLKDIDRLQDDLNESNRQIAQRLRRLDQEIESCREFLIKLLKSEQSDDISL